MIATAPFANYLLSLTTVYQQKCGFKKKKRYTSILMIRKYCDETFTCKKSIFLTDKGYYTFNYYMLKPDRFMIVDDDPLNNMLCKMVIRRIHRNPQIKLFNRPEIAVDSIKEEYGKPGASLPTLLFLDINMPSMSGWDFLDEFQKLDEVIKSQFTLYMLSSSINEKDIEKANENPLIVEFISKPLTYEIMSKIMSGESVNQYQPSSK